ncbi:uncharacterized protein LOC101845214 [Aplysia californica]|uniref:Uncharacterized protein LOC101845214 n=1 Tax=Aplysia californica TaxID=6500 RepID=A0ABM0KAV2_APLCA|nr:uncharacterized protein LOC101845214 [Aplysia californica]
MGRYNTLLVLLNFAVLWVSQATGVITSGCKAAMDTCSSTSLTSGRCQTTYNNHLLTLIRNDDNNDCMAGASDFLADAKLYYDTDGNSEVCQDEWTRVRTQYQGFTRAYVDYHWRQMTANYCMPFDDFAHASDVNLTTEFGSEAISSLVSFCLMGTNMVLNSDCMGLVTICKEKRPDVEACKNVTFVSTLYEKLQKYQRTNDANGDGLVTAQEVDAEIARYDTNNDGCISVPEWRYRWTSDYGFSTALADANYPRDVDNNRCINKVDFNNRQMPAALYPVLLIQSLVDLCERSPSSYLTNVDCAQVVDTCTNYFPQEPKCQIYLNQCGLSRYSSCVEDLQDSSCSTASDRSEVNMERLRVQNQMRDTCWGPSELKIGSRCLASIETCSETTLTRGFCKSTYGAFLLDLLRNDVDNNCMVDGTDYSADVTLNYDVNGDGRLCPNEWTERRTNYMGFTPTFTRSEWATIGGPNCTDVTAFDASPEIALRTAFANRAIGRLASFCAVGDNMRTNRDCFGLVTICKEKQPDIEACKTFNPNIRSLYENLMQVEKTNDADGDGNVTQSELAVELGIQDSDRNGCVSEAEWSQRYTQPQLYGFSPEFARAVYRTYNTNGGCLNAQSLNIPANGIPAANFPVMHIQALVNMCQGSPYLYVTNPDCAQVADTCISYFPEEPKCKVYLDNCGLQKYSKCVSDVARTSCSDDMDKAQADLEVARINNVLAEECTPAAVPAKKNPGDGASSVHVFHSLLAVANLLVFIAVFG